MIMKMLTLKLFFTQQYKYEDENNLKGTKTEC